MSILKFIITFVTTLTLLTISHGQSNNEKTKAIRKEFQKINSDSSLKTITIDDAEEFLGHGTDGGGELIGYFKKNTIYKIFTTVGLSYGEIRDEYYFKNEQLIFVYEVEKDFPYSDSLGNLDYEKINLAFEGRYYFNNGQLIDKTIKGKRRIEDREKNISTALLSDAKDFITLLKSKIK